MKNMFNKIVMFLFILGAFIFASEIKVSAGYEDVCNKGNITSNDSYFSKCDNEIVYIMPNNPDKSSYMISNKYYADANQILYAGIIDGIETFYSTGFRYYSVVYDDRGLFTSSNDMWSDISINGVLVYDGAFNDNALIDDSDSGFINNFYNEAGTYLIRQYVGRNITNVIKMIVVNKNDYEIAVNGAKFGENSLTNESFLYSNSDISFEIGLGEYGYQDKAQLTINECDFEVDFAFDLVVENNMFNHCLFVNEYNEISLTLYNGLNKSRKFNYKFMLISENLTIKLETTASLVATSSRRIVINSIAGNDKTIDETYNLYYWSTSKEDALTYEEFMKNYELSDKKGTYTSNKGVILRADDGSYYLYALAKDDDSVMVVRSDEYIIKNSEVINRIILEDVILIIGLCIGAVLPILIYLILRGKDTE